MISMIDSVKATLKPKRRTTDVQHVLGEDKVLSGVREGVQDGTS